jgi:hypothetical protein
MKALAISLAAGAALCSVMIVPASAMTSRSTKACGPAATITGTDPAAMHRAITDITALHQAITAMEQAIPAMQETVTGTALGQTPPAILKAVGSVVVS